MKTKRLLFLTLMALCATSAWAYNFSAVAPSGQTLYYNIVGGEAHVTSQISSYPYYSTYPTGSLVIPNTVVYGGVSCTVTSIDFSAFYGCSGLTSVTIPNSVTSIGNSAFYVCSGLTSVTIPNSVTSIGYSAFEHCSSLTSVTIPNSVTSIGNQAFYSCRGLTSVTIPNSVTSIGHNAFSGCSGLTSVTIGNSVTYIDQAAFYRCSGLTSVNYTGTIAQWCSIYFSHSSSNPASYSHTLSINGSPLTNLVIPEGVTEINNYAFYNCSGLTSVTIPNSVTRIGYDAFSGCSGLTSVTIPKEVTTIDDNAFYGCTSLNVIRMMPSVPPSLGNASSICDRIIDLVVPHNSYSAYINAGVNFTRHHIYSDSVIVTVLVNDTSRGSVIGFDSVYIYPSYVYPTPDTITLTTVPYYGYHFARWDDNTTDSVRRITNISHDTTLTAYFAPNLYTVSLCSTHGTAGGAGDYFYLSNHTISANADYGYHFVAWNDGDTNNPRTILLTQDTSFTALFDKNIYTFTAISCDTAKGTVTGSTSIEYLDSVTIMAIPNYGYHFTAWNDGNTDNPRTIVATRDSMFTASFDFNQYTITINVDTNIHGSVVGDGLYNYLSEQTVTATANYGYHFTAWSDGDTNNPRTIILTQDTIFTALFAKNTYAITAISADTVKGSVTGSTSIEYLDSVTIVAIPNYGYHFTAWNDGNTDNPRTIVATRDSVFAASFGYNQYSITLNVDTNIHGSVDGGGLYNYLSEQTITATANYGYHFTVWNDGDTTNPRTITLTQDTVFTALFAKNSYNVTVVSADTIQGNVVGSTTTEYLDTVSIAATANYGYHFLHWNDGDTTNPRVITLMRDTLLTAYFTKNWYSVIGISDNETMGYVTGSDTVEYLDSVSLSATSNYGYHFSSWNDGDTNNPRVVCLTQDTSFVALFAKNQYALTVQSNDETQGSVSNGGVFDYLDTVTIIASASEHYHFVRWDDGNTDNPREYVIVGDATLTAIFAIDTHTVTVTTNDIARGMVEATGSEFSYGTPCTVTATAYTGFEFIRWSNGVTANPYTFAVLGDVELTAIFVAPGEETYTVTVSVNDPTMGTATVNGNASATVTSGTEVTLTATSNEGYRFVRWNDNNTNAVRTITVTSDMSFTATFEAMGSTEGIDEADGQTVVVYATEGSIHIDAAQPAEANIYDMMGHRLATVTTGTSTPLPAGVYLVKVGTQPARKVVVIR